MFAIRNLCVLSYAQGFTLWHYRAGAATLAETEAAGFFDAAAAADIVMVGDMIVIVAADGGAIRSVATITPNVVLVKLS